MKVCGIICEYNPFHNGHLHHIQEARKLTNCDCLVVVLSGNYVQRGDFSILNKWEKTKLALEFGCDLVIELPYFYAVQSATYFAKYAMKLLTLAKVDCFVFGSESNQLEQLIDFSKLEIRNWIPFVEEGSSFAKINESIFGKMGSNDILGINYIKYSNGITPYCIQRTNHYFSEEIEKISSATAIRKAIKEKRDYTNTIPYSLKLNYRSIAEKYSIIQNKLITLPPSYLKSLFLMDEGIESLMIEAAKKCDNYETFLDYCTSKRYTHSKINRTLIHLLVHTTKEEINSLPDPNYIRVLGFNSIGQKHLKNLDCIVATNISQIPHPFKDLEIKASYVYYNQLPKFEIQKPIIKDNDI